MITGSQIRAARALLNWTSAQTAEMANLTRQTLHRLETHDDVPPSRSGSLFALEQLFIVHGVEFIDADEYRGEGVRFVQRLKQRRSLAVEKGAGV
ncbi:MAG: helix-turn-helix transcriptional regulator [Rhizobiaceae bacterium]|nr:helix-turn-helix transcriptional regulator [Rhizobiaceae bacterium]